MMQFPQKPIAWMTASVLLVLAAPALLAGEAAEPSAIADERLAGSSSIDLLSADGSTREQMAMGLLRALEVAGFDPPACVPGDEVFDDVPASNPFCPFIEELVRRGITSGCGGGNYCPSAAVSRAQMAIFLVRSLEATRGPSGGVTIPNNQTFPAHGCLTFGFTTGDAAGLVLGDIVAVNWFQHVGPGDNQRNSLILTGDTTFDPVNPSLTGVRIQLCNPTDTPINLNVAPGTRAINFVVLRP